MLLTLFILIVLLIGKYLINRLRKRNATLDQLYKENIISTLWELYYKITESPLHIQNVWGCDKTCQPNESGFFRLLNFRGKFHSSTHVQEGSPNCYGCLVAKIHKQDMSKIDVLYLESFLLLHYVSTIAETIYQMFQIADDKVSLLEMDNFRHIYKITVEISLAFQSKFYIKKSNYTTGSLKKHLETLNSKFVQHNFKGRSKMQQLFRKRQNQIRITEPQLICSMLGLNELFENYLLELDMESINHQTLVYFLNRWLENTVQAIEETDRSISLYDCMLRIGLSEEKATTYIGYLCEEFINMYSSMYWLSRYFENLCLMNPLITEIPRTCLFEGDFNVWKSGQVQRVNNNENFELKFLNQKSPVRLDNRDIDLTCERVSRYLKKQKDKDSLFLFHGTSLLSAVNILERGINLVKGKQNLDFSHAKGFYVINNLRKSVEWSCTHKPELHAVVIFKLKKTEMDNGNGLVLEDEREWGEVVTACRKGFENDNGPEVEDRLQNVDFVRGFICANGREVHRNNHNPVIMEERDGYRPLQTCILNKDYARWFGSPANIFGLVVFRYG
ncbi:uncharacterized protein LOC131935244 [Physella acuta]|uniref:uncharacterized protein LOC131935244 n=1 Tax=Physella acuta TaxID=109671 RepID=UPI0027DB3B6A|nr:uncharacterized protein LOC131935244 [Physella acuta]